MTSNFETAESNQQPVAPGNLERDRFELLSAYLDGEVTPAQRREVQQWLDSEPQIQRLYTRLLRLRQGWQNLPLPTPEPSAQQLSEQVFACIERRRWRRIWLWGGGAIAALFIGTIWGLFPTDNSLPQFSWQQQEADTDEEHLMIALNHSPIEIPPAAALPLHKSNQPKKQ